MSDILDTTPVRVQRVNRNQTIHHHHYPRPLPVPRRQPSATEQALDHAGVAVVGTGLGILAFLAIAAVVVAGYSANEPKEPIQPKKES